jgi:hypothetical protein
METLHNVKNHCFLFFVEKKQKTAVMKFKTDIIANLAVGGSMILY